MDETSINRLQSLYNNYRGKQNEMRAFTREYFGITFIILLAIYAFLLYQLISPSGWGYLVVLALSLIIALGHLFINYWIFKPYFERIFEYCEILNRISDNIREIENEDPDLYLRNMIYHR